MFCQKCQSGFGPQLDKMAQHCRMSYGTLIYVGPIGRQLWFGRQSTWFIDIDLECLYCSLQYNSHRSDKDCRKTVADDIARQSFLHIWPPNMLAFTNIKLELWELWPMLVWGLDLHMVIVWSMQRYPRMTKPVLGRSLVFMITARSRYETVLKDPTRFFFKILFSYF
jgi:hypothetical protein